MIYLFMNQARDCWNICKRAFSRTVLCSTFFYCVGIFFLRFRSNAFLILMFLFGTFGFLSFV